MAKKRSRAQASAKAPKASNETFDDSEDEFLKGRDRILFDDEGPAAKRRRKLEEDEAELMPSDEEVYEEELSDDEEAASPEGTSDDEAVARASGDEEDERYWGDTRSDYYNADAIETEQDALDEEAEARRLQQKQLQDMTEADFGFDELAWADVDKDGSRKPTVEKLPPVQIPENATDSERLEILRARYPEFEPLATDLTSHYTVYLALKDQVDELRKAKSTKVSVIETRLRALTAYLAAIAMYMAVLTSTKDGRSLPPAELREHPIMHSLLQSRQLWEGAQELDSDVDDEDEELAVERPATTQPVKAPNGVSNTVKSTKFTVATAKGASSGDLPATSPDSNKRKKAKKEKDPKASNETAKKSKKAKAKTDKPKHATLEDLMAQSVPDNEEESDFGDEVPLTAEEAAEKARKKKSLRFYTSQIAQKAGKRAAASRQAGGDDDLPYKERIRDRQERLMREAENRNQRDAAEEADAGFSDDYDENDLATKMNTDANDYYATLVGANAAKKSEKAARAEAQRAAAAQGGHVYEEATVGPDGKRKITYAIEKNKGLQPRRKKEVRNPRVKKKKKFEEKQKKLASMRPVWKGGEGKGGYKGELTGIKSNVVKSVKL